MATEAGNENVNFYQVGMTDHFYNLIDHQLYHGEIIGVVHDKTGVIYKIFLTLKTELGFISIQVY